MGSRPAGSTPVPSAVLFDCDGTLADTEPLFARVFDLVLARYGGQLLPDDQEQLVGRPLHENHAYLAERIALPPYERFSADWFAVAAGLVESELTLFDDSVEVLHHVAGAGTPVGVVTTSPREHVRRVLAHRGLGGQVRAVVAFEDVDAHKPDPAPYLRAAELLGVDPRTAVAVEDSQVGVASAQAAGMACVGVVRAGVDAAALAAADLVVERVAVDQVLALPRARPAASTP